MSHPAEDDGPEHCHAHHNHAHSHAPATFGTAFAIGVALNAGFVLVEVICGLLAHSLALVADAGHNLGDVFGLLLAWGAMAWSTRSPTARHTYGWRRSSILAALGNAIFLLVSVGVIAWEAVRRLREPVPVATQTMIWVAAIGIAINAATAALFMAGRKGDLNIRAAFQHMAADAALSAGVVVAGVAMAFTGWLWLDPLMGLLLAVVIVIGTWRLLRESFDLALDGVPAGIDTAAVQHYLASRPAVVDVHHLHIWGLSTTDAALTAHLTLSDMTAGDELLHEISHELAERFHIGHATIQFESTRFPDCGSKQCLADGRHDVHAH